MSGKENRIFKFIMDIIRTLTTQSNVKLSSLKYLRQYKIHCSKIIILVIFWLLITNIITKCFTSLLLNSYFKQTSVPLLNNLQEVFEQEQFLIAAKTNTFSFMFNYGLFKKEQVDSLWERRNKYQEKFDFSFDVVLAILNRNIFNDVVNGLAVILINGFEKESFEAQYISESNKFKVLDQKYVSNFAGHLIWKGNKHLEQIKFP